MKKRMLSILLALAMCLTLLPSMALAEGEETASLYSGGSGTEADPYKISSAADLQTLATKVNEGTTHSGVFFALTDDIDLSVVCGENLNGGTSWTPIGSSRSNSFNGTFDGQGHTVSGLYVSISKTYESAYAGLFGFVGSGGTVKNLAVSGEVSATTQQSTAISCSAYAGGVAGDNRGKVENCSFSGSVSAKVNPQSSNSTRFADAGGVVGYNYGGTVKNCYHTGAVTGSSTQRMGKIYAGGVAGYNYGTVTNCYHGTGTVTGEGTAGAKSVGGVVGFKDGGTVESCYFLQVNNGLSGIGNDTSSNSAVAKTADEFASGEVTWLLNGESVSGAWYQNLQNNGYNTTYFPADNCPVLDLTHLAVQKNVDGDAVTYTNTLPVDSTGTYLIYTAEQLKFFAGMVNGGSTNINAKLMADIDLSTMCNETLGSWTPIGSSSRKFTGAFDGQGHTVSGLYISIMTTHMPACLAMWTAAAW